MKVRRLTWRRYRIPLRRAFVTSGGSRAMREGFIVRVETDDGLHGLGEIAPLREGAAENIARLLELIARRIAGVEVDEAPQAIQFLDAPADVAAAIRCGLDIAACDLLAKAAAVPVAELLGGRRRRQVPVNATIGEPAQKLATRLARRAVRNGFRCVKLKVGMKRNLELECGLAGAVLDAIGGRALMRLDANQAWDVDTAIEYVAELYDRFEFEFIEQPVAAGNIEGLAKVRKSVDAPIAADEAVTGLASATAIIETGAAGVLVVKPMVVGGLRPAMEIIGMAGANGVESVVTTTIDSGVGVAAALHLAAAFEGKLACGLATAELLESDLTAPLPQPTDSFMACPDSPGLGVEIDEVKAAPYLERA